MTWRNYKIEIFIVLAAQGVGLASYYGFLKNYPRFADTTLEMAFMHQTATALNCNVVFILKSLCWGKILGNESTANHNRHILATLCAINKKYFSLVFLGSSMIGAFFEAGSGRIFHYQPVNLLIGILFTSFIFAGFLYPKRILARTHINTIFKNQGGSTPLLNRSKANPHAEGSAETESGHENYLGSTDPADHQNLWIKPTDGPSASAEPTPNP